MDDIAELRQRIEVLERYVALSLASSNVAWSSPTGLIFSRNPNREVTDMIAGYTDWNPGSLDKGG